MNTMSSEGPSLPLVEQAADEEDEGFHSPSISRTCSLTASSAGETPSPPLKEEPATAQRVPLAGEAAPQLEHCQALSRQLVAVVVGRALGQQVQSSSSSSSNNSSRGDTAEDLVQRTLLRCCDEFLQQHGQAMSSMVLNLTQSSHGAEVFASVADELFEGEKRLVSWPRIVALYCFAGEYAKQCQRRGRVDDGGRRMVEHIGRYCSGAVATFVCEQGGWARLCEEFPEEGGGVSSPSSPSVWSILKWGALSVGVATASHLISR